MNLSPNEVFHLNKSEWKMIHLIARGFAQKEIAFELGLSNGTVKQYVVILRKKLGVQWRSRGTFVLVCERISGCLGS